MRKSFSDFQLFRISTQALDLAALRILMIISPSINLSLYYRIGAASACINTGSYSFAAQAYPDDVEKVISIMEAIVGIGCAAGPVLGSVTYELIGFAWTFIIFGALMTPAGIALFLFLQKPKDVKA